MNLFKIIICMTGLVTGQSSDQTSSSDNTGIAAPPAIALPNLNAPAPVPAIPPAISTTTFTAPPDTDIVAPPAPPVDAATSVDADATVSPPNFDAAPPAPVPSLSGGTSPDSAPATSPSKVDAPASAPTSASVTIGATAGESNSDDRAPPVAQATLAPATAPTTTTNSELEIPETTQSDITSTDADKKAEDKTTPGKKTVSPTLAKIAALVPTDKAPTTAATTPVLAEIEQQTEGTGGYSASGRVNVMWSVAIGYVAFIAAVMA